MIEEKVTLAWQHDLHKSTADDLAAALDTHKEEIEHKEMMLEQIKEVRDSVVEDLAKQVEINNETNAEKLQNEVAYLVHLIQT